MICAENRISYCLNDLLCKNNIFCRADKSTQTRCKIVLTEASRGKELNSSLDHLQYVFSCFLQALSTIH